MFTTSHTKALQPEVTSANPETDRQCKAQSPLQSLPAQGPQAPCAGGSQSILLVTMDSAECLALALLAQVMMHYSDCRGSLAPFLSNFH